MHSAYIYNTAILMTVKGGRGGGGGDGAEPEELFLYLKVGNKTMHIYVMGKTSWTDPCVKVVDDTICCNVNKGHINYC